MLLPPYRAFLYASLPSRAVTGAPVQMSLSEFAASSLSGMRGTKPVYSVTEAMGFSNIAFSESDAADGSFAFLFRFITAFSPLFVQNIFFEIFRVFILITY